VIDFAPMLRGARWICAASGSIEARAGVVADRLATSRARVSRAIAREFIGGSSEELVSYRDWLREELDRGVESFQDAETLLWSMLALSKHSGDAAHAVRQQLADIVAASEDRGPCSSGSWVVPSLWSDQGGRLVSTALMAWTGKARYGSTRLRFR
jgi:hypothetical protein